MEIQSPFTEPRFIQELQNSLSTFLPTQRWFGDKARAIQSVDIVASFSIETMPTPATFTVIAVAFKDGGMARYVLPLTLVEDPRDLTGSIGSVEFAGRAIAILDAVLEPSFRAWMLRILIDGRPVRAGIGQLEVDRHPNAVELLTRAIGEPSRVLGVEQSNSSLVYGTRIFVKVFRRLQAGINPDVELNRFLTLRGRFDNIPGFLGSISYVPPTGEATVVAVAQTYVDSVSDSWELVLGLLSQSTSGGRIDGWRNESESVARRLGEVTAGMHLALSSDHWTPDFAPETISSVDTSEWRADYLVMLEAVVQELSSEHRNFDAGTSELVAAFLELVPGLRNRAGGFDRLIGRAKSRVHGDYHLGQILLTSTGDLVVIDFEGEPQRPIAERRRKTSPLKDVAGMLRSFAYARGSMTSSLDASQVGVISDLIGWERAMRQVYLDAYVESAKRGGAAFLPGSDADIRAAVAAWELDKAAYEIRYELNNRPDWLWIPLSAMLKLGEPEA